VEDGSRVSIWLNNAGKSGLNCRDDGVGLFSTYVRQKAGSLVAMVNVKSGWFAFISDEVCDRADLGSKKTRFCCERLMQVSTGN